MRLDEQALEEEIVAWLAEHGGYGQEQSTRFDAATGLDYPTTLSFITKTQPDQWRRLVAAHRTDSARVERAFEGLLAKELNSRGTIDVLRRGVTDRGVTIHLAYFRPAHGLTPELVARYEANILTVVRQLRYEQGSNRAVDLALLVNGIPTATAELKNPLTGQTVGQAIEQYRTDRDPANLTLGRRAVVHFALDTERVAMTTRLAGRRTIFLPFNRGDAGGAGNPVNPDGHRTAYLWHEVWHKDSWLDMLQRFVHVERQSRASAQPSTVIFPRYHQWDAVRQLERAVLLDGPGRDYLVQHSAGSGKSNTIAWLAHRLATLHSPADAKAVFDKVVVITDRRALDRQLQDTIFQFEHASGVVEKIDTNSRKLEAALAGTKARIIITTLQKFPVVVKHGVDLPEHRYAVIVDEAHSSQSGENVKNLNTVLGSSARQQLQDAESAEAEQESREPASDALTQSAAARGSQPNISLFGFTATPTGGTLEKFGRLNQTSGRFEAFHLYTMRQAIEEGFILDVLANYTTYKTYWNIEKRTLADPRYDPARAGAAIAGYVETHRDNLGPKAEAIIEHYRRHVQHKIGGAAKAMLVTASRLHAVRYTQELREYCRAQGYPIGILAAFTGTVLPRAEDHTEASLNGFPESQTVSQFATDDWQILVVARKYQTGFDQPLLYAMYVDKPLTGLAAVQTLSRLNRTIDGKDGTFVLDFRNEAESIRASFAPWFTFTEAPPTDPHIVDEARSALDRFALFDAETVERVVAILLGDDSAGAHGRLHAALAPTIDKFAALKHDEADEFRDALARFTRAYAYLSQIVDFTALEADYLFCKALGAFIKPPRQAGLDLGDEVELTHLRTEQTFAGSLSLDAAHGEVSTLLSGIGLRDQGVDELLSTIIARLNERFGTQWTERDRVFLDEIADRLVARPEVQRAAAVNTPENFKIFLAQAFTEQLVEQMNVAEEMALKLLDNPQEQELVLTSYLKLVQGRAKVAWQEHCPVTDLIGGNNEGKHLEYKSALRTHYSGELHKPLESVILKTIAGFANSHDGGTLLIGVTDDGSVHGLATDYATLHKSGKDDRDLFQLYLGDITSASMGAATAALATMYIHDVDGADICRVHVRPSGAPVEAKVTVEKDGQLIKKTAFYVRASNATRELTPEETTKYISGRWPSYRAAADGGAPS
jgi:type I restriction enzyme R subunit